jgi:hypothetical protein
MPRPKRVYDPLTGAYDTRRSAEPMPVKQISDHAYVPSTPSAFPDEVGLSRPGPYRSRGRDTGRQNSISGRRIA